MAGDEAAGDTGTGLQKAADRLRETTKWLIAAFAAIGATLVAGSQLSSIGSLVPDHWWRFKIAVAGVLAAIVGVAWAITAALKVATAGSVSLGALANLRPNDPLKKRLEDDKALMAGHEDLKTLSEGYAEALTVKTDSYNAYLRARKDPATLSEAQTTAANAKFISQTVQNILEVASFEDVARTFNNARWHLFGGAVLAALGVTIFVAAANPPKDERLATRPGITVKLGNSGKTLEATFHGVGLTHDESLHAWVTRRPGNTSVFRGLFGPDSSGKVERTVTFPLATRKQRSSLLLRAWSGDVQPKCTLRNRWKAWRADSTATCTMVTIPAKAVPRKTKQQ